MDNARGQPIILPAGGMFLRDRAAIAQALLERRIPSIAAFRENMEAGALISYGFDLMELFYFCACSPCLKERWIRAAHVAQQKNPYSITPVGACEQRRRIYELSVTIPQHA
jgi:hypothetical protein